MSKEYNRRTDFRYARPLGTSRRLALHAKKPSPGTRIAELDHSGSVAYVSDPSFGWLTQLRSGRFVVEQVTGQVRSIAEKDVREILEVIEAHPKNAQGVDELADELRSWRRGDAPEGEFLFSAARAAEMLGLPLRTYEGIEQGRGFRYPQLLRLALLAFKGSPG